MSWDIAITGLVTLLAAIFGSTGFWTYRMTKRMSDSAEKKMLMGLTYINIVKNCEYWIERGWVEQDDLRDLEKYLYDPYREKGGNGTAERLFNQAAQLPNKPPKGE